METELNKLDINNIKIKIENYFSECREAMIDDIKSLVRIKSVRESTVDGAPFGYGPAMCLDKGLEIASKLGFITENAQNYCGIADYVACDGNSDAELGILAHLDVVSEGNAEDWNYAPYGAEVETVSGKMYGRGTADDKGPAVAALYAVKAAADIIGGIKKPVRIILGCSEETGSEDLDYYSQHYKMPSMVFTPDADFPVINFEKARIATRFSRTFEDSDIDSKVNSQLKMLEFNGGTTQNIVPQEAICKIKYVSQEAMEMLSSTAEKATLYTNVNFKIEVENATESIYTITAKGIGAHASTPDEGNNAQTGLLCLLVDLFNRHKINVCFENSCAECMRCNEDDFFGCAATLLKLMPHNQTNGKNMGIAFTHGKTGSLTLNFGVLHYENKVLHAGIDIRIPMCSDYDELIKTLKNSIECNGFSINEFKFTEPHYVDENSPFVQTLLKSYNDITGLSAKCLYTGGGTYVHDIPGGVAFGCQMPGTNNKMHGTDEFIVIDDIIKSAEIFTLAIVRLCC